MAYPGGGDGSSERHEKMVGQNAKSSAINRLGGQRGNGLDEYVCMNMQINVDILKGSCY